MDVASIAGISIAFLSSLAFNIHLLLKIKRKAKEPALTMEAKDLLHDILSGTAILRISVIDPGDILIRSPRG